MTTNSSHLQQTGSSPRVRGTVRARLARRAEHRFIPASAGNSAAAVARMVVKPVHPRECGEQALQPAFALSFRGSSPRVRGTVKAEFTTLKTDRFIPASAGNRLMLNLIITIFYGSSPRVRGTVKVTMWKIDMMRFIPASAGNSL